MIKYLRFRIFQALLRPFSEYFRRRRAKKFMRLMSIEPGMKILDIGGQPKIWDYVEMPLAITCLNLPGVATTDYKTHHNITYVEGDGCSMPEFSVGRFDVIFSNSVIEHVGDSSKRRMFASEVRRLSSRYWIQTPFKYFPIEAHTGMPFWWLYPESWRAHFINRWRGKLPAWTDMVETTDVVSTSELGALFPEAKVFKEWFVFPKSLVACAVSDPT